MKAQYIKVDDFLISHIDGSDCRYEKKSGGVVIGSNLSLSRLKYCVKHSKAHRLYLNEFQNYFLNPIDFEPSDEYEFYYKVKILVERLINFLNHNHDIKSIVDYGNQWIDAQIYQELPIIPDVQFSYYIDTSNQTMKLVKYLVLYKDRIFTQNTNIA